MKLTQHQLILAFIKEHGSITPARLKDSDRAYIGQWIGAEAGRRARELVKKGLLVREKVGKFERFMLSEGAQILDFIRDFAKNHPEYRNPGGSTKIGEHTLPSALKPQYQPTPQEKLW